MMAHHSPGIAFVVISLNRRFVRDIDSESTAV